MKTKFSSILLISIPLLILLVLAGVYFAGKSSRSVKGSSPAYKITAREINIAYIQNDSIADLKYLNRIIQISGKVASIKKSEAHGTIVTLDDPMMGVKCIMDSAYLPKPSAISVGDDVKIKGICLGSDQLVGVMFNNCLLVESTKKANL